ncbi:MAG: glycosyltransferase [Candidatus Chlorobium antarcticum]|jgi:glycosyltransferase involved in cell wall biosynthesis|nr:glycosyltransferase [Candidatus Chlorobium antarcticum]
MNILFINSIGKNKFGGGEKWMVNAAKGLTERGHQITLASKKDSKILRYAKDNGVKTEVINIRGDFSPLATLKIASWLKQHQTDILICNLNKDVRVAGLAARIAETPVVLARHGMLLCSRKWKHKLTLTNLTDGIITNSLTIKETYGEYGWFSKNFVKVIYNGLVIPEKVEPFDFSKRFPGKKIIYSAGRLSEQKGFAYLIEAAAILKKSRNDLVFAISGEGKLEEELKTQIKAAGLEDSFVLLGFTANIFPYLKGCDLFVLASLFEGMPNVVMEAMGMKKPVITTDVNGARELMGGGTKNKTGMIIPPRDPKAIADAISELIDSPETLQAYGQAGYERVNSEFTMTAMTDNLEKHLQQKLREKSIQ